MTTIWDNAPKPNTGLGGWNYDELGYTYDQLLDPTTGAIVYYDSAGILSIWNNQTKN